MARYVVVIRDRRLLKLLVRAERRGKLVIRGILVLVDVPEHCKKSFAGLASQGLQVRRASLLLLEEPL